MSSGSIINFESLSELRPRLPAALLAVAAIVAFLEVTVRLIPDEKLEPAKSKMGEVVFLEREVLPKFPAPKIVLLGSSRIRRAVVPKLLDEKLGLKPNSTVNLGMAAGRIFDACYLYQRNRQQLRLAQLVVLALDDWHFSSSGFPLGSNYEVHGPYLERFGFSESQRGKLLLDGLFTIRMKLKRIPEALLVSLGWRRNDPQPLTLTDENQVLPPPRNEVDPRRDEKIVGDHYDHFELQAPLAGHIDRLARMVKEDGGRLLLLHLPNRSSYRREVALKHPKEFEMYKTMLEQSAARVGAPLTFYNTPVECGLSDSSYEDYGHINREGAHVFTTFFAEKVGAELKAKALQNGR